MIIDIDTMIIIIIIIIICYIVLFAAIMETHPMKRFLWIQGRTLVYHAPVLLTHFNALILMILKVLDPLLLPWCCCLLIKRVTLSLDDALAATWGVPTQPQPHWQVSWCLCNL